MAGGYNPILLVRDFKRAILMNLLSLAFLSINSSLQKSKVMERLQAFGGFGSVVTFSIIHKNNKVSPITEMLFVFVITIVL